MTPAAADLARSGLTPKEAARLKIRMLTPAETKDLCGKDFASYAIPYHDINGVDTGFYRLRFVGEGPFHTEPDQRYWQPPNTQPQLYLPPVLDWAKVKSDPSIKIEITEGEKKAAVGCLRGTTMIGLGGVWSWRSKKGGVMLLPDLEAFAQEGRCIDLCFDSDANNRTDLLAAMYALSVKLESLGVIVSRVELPKLPDQEKTGVDDYLLVKTMADYLALPRVALPLTSALHALNTSYAILLDPPGEVFSIKLSKPVALDKFFVLTATEKVQGFDAYGKVTRLDAGREWVGWKKRRVITELVYEPDTERVPKGAHNLWTGWGVEPAEGEIGPWTEIMDNVFGDIIDARAWFDMWCAYPFQRPGAKLLTAVVFWGGQGIGKSVTGETLIRLYGESNSSRVSSDQLHSQFNSWAARKQFILAEEVASTERRADANRLKDMITRRRVTVNEKFQPTYTLDDHANYLLTSNAADPLLLEDDDRRFFVHRVVGGRLSTAWGKRYDRWLINGGASHLMYHLIYNVDTRAFRPKDPAPMTQSKLDAIEASKSDLELFLGRVVNDYEGVFKVGDVVTPCDFQTTRGLLAQYEREYRTSRATGFGGAMIWRILARFGDKVLKLDQVRTRDGIQRFYVFRNVAKWRKASPFEVADHYNNVTPLPRQAEVVDLASRRKF